MAVCAEGEGRVAHTSYRIVERLFAATLMEAQIHTGRTHQIRVHFQFLGHPIVGDSTYGTKANKRLLELTKYEAPRVMLHAYELTLVHPRTGKTMTFQAPLPADFQAALKFLKA
jgi:23S rRNA pseudouridine1911/1915/1917 synthase